MNIFIPETAQYQRLTLVDPKTNSCFITDFIAPYGAFDDGQFTYDEERNAFICSQETFNWWDKVIDAHQSLEYRI